MRELKWILALLLWVFALAACGGSDPAPEPQSLVSGSAGSDSLPPSKPASCPPLESELPYPCSPGMACRFQGVGVLTQCDCLPGGSFQCGTFE